MTVVANQPVKAAVVNAAFVSKITDSTMECILTLDDDASGSIINNTQEFINEIADTVGLTEGDVDRKNYANNFYIADGDSRKVAIEKIDSALNDTDVIVADHTIDIADHESRLDAIEPDLAALNIEVDNFKAEKGAASGLCPLDAGSKVDPIYLPSYVDDVLEYADFASLPITGEQGKIYVTLDTNKTYRWTGSIYVQVGGEVSGPGSSTNGAIARFNGTTGKVIMNSSVILENSGIFGFTVEDNNTTGSNATISTVSAAIIRLINASLVSIDMIAALSSGREFTLVNATGNEITINNDTGATAANRIYTGTGDAITLANQAAVKLQYDQSYTRWRIVGGSGSGGAAGGSGSFEWLMTGANSPLEKIVDGMKFLAFDGESGHEVYGVFKVPSTYKPGKQIKLKGLEFYCSLASGNILFKAHTALIESGSTIIGTYSNIHTSTNAQVALSVANRVESVGIVDLTDSSGQINSVAVASGDTLRIRLTRDFASETGGPYLVDANLNRNTASIEVQ